MGNRIDSIFEYERGKTKPRKKVNVAEIRSFSNKPLAEMNQKIKKIRAFKTKVT